MSYNSYNLPETQVVLPLLESDLLKVMTACTEGTLADTEVRFSDGAAACVILASGGYPVAYEKGKHITGLVDGQLQMCIRDRSSRPAGNSSRRG